MEKPNIDDMTRQVISWRGENPHTNDFEKFINTPREDLIIYHSTLGRYIRNYFSLWSYKHTPELVNGVDVSPNHPDAISMRVIEKVWEHFQNV